MVVSEGLIRQFGLLHFWRAEGVQKINILKEFYDRIITPSLILTEPTWHLSQKKQCQSEIKKLSKRIRVLKNILPSLPEEKSSAVKIQIKKLEEQLKEKRGFFKNIVLSIGLIPSVLAASPGANPWNSLVQIAHRALGVSENIDPSAEKISLEAAGAIMRNAISLAGTSALLMNQLSYLDENNPISQNLQNAALGVTVLEGVLAFRSTYTQANSKCGQ